MLVLSLFVLIIGFLGWLLADIFHGGLNDEFFEVFVKFEQILKKSKGNKILLAQKIQRSKIIYRSLQEMIVNFDKDCLYPEERFEVIWNHIEQHNHIYNNLELTTLLKENWFSKYREVFRKRESIFSIDYKNHPIVTQ